MGNIDKQTEKKSLIQTFDEIIDNSYDGTDTTMKIRYQRKRIKQAYNDDCPGVLYTDNNETFHIVRNDNTIHIFNTNDQEITDKINIDEFINKVREVSKEQKKQLQSTTDKMSKQLQQVFGEDTKERMKDKEGWIFKMAQQGIEDTHITTIYETLSNPHDLSIPTIMGIAEALQKQEISTDTLKQAEEIGANNKDIVQIAQLLTKYYDKTEDIKTMYQNNINYYEIKEDLPLLISGEVTAEDIISYHKVKKAKMKKSDQ